MSDSSRIAPGGFFKDTDFDFEARIALGARQSASATSGWSSPPWTGSPTATRRAGSTPGPRPRHAGAAGRRGRRGRPTAHRGLGVPGRRRVLREGDGRDRRPGRPVGAVADLRRAPALLGAVIDESEGRHVRFEVPYVGHGRHDLPGYLLRPDASGAAGRPWWSPTAATARWPRCRRRGRGRAHPRLERLPYDGPGPAVHAVRAGAVPARLGGGAHPRRRRPGRPGRRRRRRAARLRHQPGGLLAAAGAGLRTPVGRRGRRPRRHRRVHVLDRAPAAGDARAAGRRAEGRFNGFMAQVDADPAIARTFAFRARPYGIADPFDVFTEVASTTSATSRDRSAPRC